MGKGVVVVSVVFITLTDRAPTIFTETTLHTVANPVRGLLDREAN